MHEKKKAQKMKSLNECNSCSKTFKRLDALKRHHKLVHQKKKLQKLRKSSKKQYESSHEEENSLNCVICSNKFIEKHELQAHILSIHGKNVPMDSL